ncbi:MAG: acylneuraminate cytidylyltransferase family protein [Flavobacteriaceae bacterium]|nr:acylneuraminate cytidylyltransferase family protein [Flavobacteriaceae bacterium]
MSLSSQKYIAIIPARKNSKRLPHKNTMLLGGKALVMHSIDFALKHQHIFTKIIVTTDDEAVMKLARKNDIEVVVRPDDLASDTATTVSALKHALANVSESFDAVVLLQPTNPFRKANLLTNAIAAFETNGKDSLLTVSSLHKKFGTIKAGVYHPENYKIGQRSQDLESLYFENGLLYITQKALIFSDKMLGENPLTLITDYPEAHIDIDTADDFKLAEFYAQTFVP